MKLVYIVLGLKGVVCAIRCPLMLTVNPGSAPQTQSMLCQGCNVLLLSHDLIYNADKISHKHTLQLQLVNILTRVYIFTDEQCFKHR